MSIENRKRVEEIYAQQRNYIVIGLTGRYGSGCTTTRKILEGGLYDPNDYLGSGDTQDITNSDRDQEIILNFMRNNMVKFDVIRVRDILTMFILEEPHAFYCLLKECKGKKEDEIDTLKEEFFRYFKENGEFLWDGQAKNQKDRGVLFEQAQSMEELNQQGDPNDSLEFPAPEAVVTQSTAFPEETASQTVVGENVQPAVVDSNEVSRYENPFVIATQKWKKLWTGLMDDFEKFIREIDQDQWDFLMKNLGQISDLIRKYMSEKCSVEESTIIFQRVGNMVRTFGKLMENPEKQQEVPGKMHAVAERIHILIKILRRKDIIADRLSEKPTRDKKKNNVHVVIDSIKNVFEANYLRARYDSFFLVALTLDDQQRFRRLNLGKRMLREQINFIDVREQSSLAKNIWKKKESGGEEYEELFGSGDYGQMYYNSYKTDSYMFNLQDVDGCIQNADILINNSGTKEQLKLTIMRYISLMLHPGLVTPTQDEVCMQIAQAAKLNSGCISRQVGAVVSDMYGNILSIGWNDPAATQGNECISCIRRSVKKLFQGEDTMAYSHYELSDEDFQSHFRKAIQGMVDRIRSENRADSEDSGRQASEVPVGEMTDEQLLQAIDIYVTKKLKGLPLAYCFKDIYTDMIGERNQVHTRAQHGEEKAMENCDKSRCSGGTLYTTSSSCELCAKKALGYNIRRIVYIEPYSGITNKHILGHQVHHGVQVVYDGVPRTESMKIELFTGATQRAYTHLYTAFFPLKDELALRGINYKTIKIKR